MTELYKNRISVVVLWVCEKHLMQIVKSLSADELCRRDNSVYV